MIVKQKRKIEVRPWNPSFPRKAYDRFKSEHTFNNEQEMIEAVKEYGNFRETPKCWDESHLELLEYVREFSPTKEDEKIDGRRKLKE